KTPASYMNPNPDSSQIQQSIATSVPQTPVQQSTIQQSNSPQPAASSGIKQPSPQPVHVHQQISHQESQGYRPNFIPNEIPYGYNTPYVPAYMPFYNPSYGYYNSSYPNSYNNFYNPALSNTNYNPVPSYNPANSVPNYNPMQTHNPYPFAPSSFAQSPIPTQNVLSQANPTSYIDYINGKASNLNFFKEFEEYLRNNGLNNGFIDELLDKDLFDHMIQYHTAGEGVTQFYGPNPELSHAIKLKFEELQGLEKSWMSNTQKLELLKRLGLSLESEIRSKSEGLKNLMLDSKRRSVSVVNSGDFFRILRPKSDEIAKPETMSYDTTSATVPNKTQEEVQYQVSEPPERIKYDMNKYVLYDGAKYFYARNGQIFRSLSEFIEGIEVMDKDTFEFHANLKKNDFANWIKGVFGDLRLSDAIRPLIDQERLWYYLKDNV
ncbi:MAG: hypothetical protein ACP5OA_01865, partial [Candidatus Woesearchaeota archaeon]